MQQNLTYVTFHLVLETFACNTSKDEQATIDTIAVTHSGEQQTTTE